MEDVIGKSDEFAEQFVDGGITQFLEGQQNGWAISVSAAGTVDHRDNSKIRRQDESAPRTGDVDKAPMTVAWYTWCSVLRQVLQCAELHQPRKIKLSSVCVSSYLCLDVLFYCYLKSAG